MKWIERIFEGSLIMIALYILAAMGLGFDFRGLSDLWGVIKWCISAIVVSYVSEYIIKAVKF